MMVRRPARADRFILALSLAAICLVVPGCRKADPPPVPIDAVVNGEAIDVEEFDRRYRWEARMARSAPPARPEEVRQLKEEILNVLIQEKLMEIRARELYISVSDQEFAGRVDEIKQEFTADGFTAMLQEESVDFEAWKKHLSKRMIMEKLVQQDVNARVSLSPKEVRDFYERNKASYLHEKRVRVAQIVLRKRSLAENVLRRLKKGEDFAKVAQKISIAPESVRGGELGFVGRGTLPEEVDASVFSLPVGGISRVIKTPYGYHIFKVLERDEGGERKATDMEKAVYADARRWKEEQAYATWIGALRAKAQIRIYRDVLFEERAAAREGQS